MFIEVRQKVTRAYSDVRREGPKLLGNQEFTALLTSMKACRRMITVTSTVLYSFSFRALTTRTDISFTIRLSVQCGAQYSTVIEREAYHRRAVFGYTAKESTHRLGNLFGL